MRRGVKSEFFTTADGHKLYFEFARSSENDPVVVFLNGLSQSTQAWAAVTPKLKETAGFVCLDLIHQGRSEESPAYRSYDDHSRDVADLCNALGLHHVVLCGISYGSAVAQHLLVNYPERFRSAVLAATFAHTTPLFDAIGESWKSALLAGGYPLMLDVMLPVVLGESYFAKPLIPIPLLKTMRTANELSASCLLKLMEATEKRGDYRNKLSAVNVPVTILHGEEDLLITEMMAKEVQNSIRNSKLVVISGAGHTLNLEAIDVMANAINELL